MTLAQKTLIAIDVFWLVVGAAHYRRRKNILEAATFLLSKEMLFAAALFAITIYVSLLIFSLF